MRNSVLIALIILVLALISRPVYSDGKITVDPNANGNVKSSEEAVEPTDTRLAKLVTYEAKRRTVLNILTDLQAMTGVTLKAGYNNKDWQVRDRKMNIFAKDTSLADLMSSIARVMKFKWERGSTENAWTYRLFMDRKTLLDAEAQKQREEDRLAREEALRREESLKNYAGLSDLSPQEMEKLKSDNPFLYMIAKSGLTSSLGSFFGEVPAAAEALALGQTLNLSASSLSSNGQSNLLMAMQDIWKMQSSFDGNKAGTLPDDLPTNIGKVNIRINRIKEEGTGMPGTGFLLGDMEMRYGDKSVMVPVIDPETDMAKIIGKMMLKSEEENQPIGEIAKDYQGEIMSAVFSELKKETPAEPEVERPDDPAFKMKVTLKPKDRQLQSIEASLAEASKLTVVSDDFGSTFPLGSTPDKETELKIVLDKISEIYLYNWDKRSSIIELRDKKWFSKRANQIPEEWLERWRRTFMATGTLDIGDLSQIALLTNEQIGVNITSDETLCWVAGSIYSGREILRMYAGLTNNQRAALFTGFGLDFNNLTMDQWPQAQKLINGRNPSFLTDPDAKVILTASSIPRDKQIEYTFRATTDGDNKPIEWKFLTPRYRDPEKAKLKAADKAETEKKQSDSTSSVK